MKRLVLFFASWTSGAIAYFATLFLAFDEVPASLSGDFAAVLFWSILCYALSYVVLYLPLLRAVHRGLGGVRPWWPFPLLAVIAGAVPTALIAFFNGGGMRGLFGAEAVLFHVMFAAVGIVLGVGYVLVHRSDPASG